MGLCPMDAPLDAKRSDLGRNHAWFGPGYIFFYRSEFEMEPICCIFFKKIYFATDKMSPPHLKSGLIRI